MRKKIFHSFLALCCALLVLLTAGMTAVVYHLEQRQLADSLNQEAVTIASALETTPDNAALLSRLTLSRRVTLVNEDGTVAFDNFANPSGLENHGTREEIVQAREQGSATLIRKSGTLSEEMVYHTRLLSNGQVLRLAAPQKTLWGLLGSFLPIGVIVLLVCVGLAALLAARATRTLVAPVTAIDPEHPLDNDCYEELTPLLRRLHAQQEESARQLAALKAQQTEQDALLAHMREGLVILDAEQRIVTMNEAARQILEAPRPLPAGMTLLEMNRSAVLQELLHDLADAEAAQASMDAGGRHYHVSASRVGKGEGALLLLQDDTADHEAEAGRRQFTANVSHELRTPLTTISGYAELLENHLAASPQDEARFLSLIRKEARRMLTLVEDILRLSQLDEGSMQLNLQPVQLRELAQDTMTSLTAKAQGREVTLSLTGDSPVAVTDGALLGEVLFNLLDNAIKYNHPGGTAEVMLDTWEGHARIRVRDTGIGIPADQQQKVFERFYRVDKSRSKATGGTGLGLSIVKHAAQVLGAQIQLESAPGQGTTVTVVL